MSQARERGRIQALPKSARGGRAGERRQSRRSGWLRKEKRLKERWATVRQW
ncbi:hypothetical protein CEB3_c39330 [Peptococcaceae bacterium CEB3]|nr:hypothetical protein CEB3_c39330 [Peptococcaceae bacterium CEB3]